MSTHHDFYSILGLSKDAPNPPDEVRKAYRRKALLTHPDRLPPNATPEQKKAAEEQFRLVNNAYQVLSSPESRELYDKHGVWPPPKEQPDLGRSPATDPFGFPSDPFANNPFFDPHFRSRSGSRGPQFTFTDPFELFNSLFGDLHAAFQNDPFFANTPFTRSPFDDPSSLTPFPSPFGPMGDPFARSPFGASSTRPFGRSMFNGSPFGGAPIGFGSSPIGFGGSPFGAFFNSPAFDSSNTQVYRSTTQTIGGSDGRFISRSQTSRTINGRTESITKRIDVDGNEHVIYSSPDGERYTINGVEQSRGAINDLHRSNTAPPPPAITDKPAEPPVNVAPPPPPPAQAFSGPVFGSRRDSHAYAPQPVVPPIPSGSHVRRSSRHSHREHAMTEDYPRRHTAPITALTHHERRRSDQMDVDPPVPGGGHTSRDRERERDHSKRSSRHSHAHRDDKDAGSPTSTGSRRGGWRGWFSNVLHSFRRDHKEM